MAETFHLLVLKKQMLNLRFTVDLMSKKQYQFHEVTRVSAKVKEEKKTFPSQNKD